MSINFSIFALLTFFATVGFTAEVRATDSSLKAVDPKAVINIEGDVVRGTLNRNMKQNKSCLLSMVEENVTFCANVSASAEVVEKLLIDADGAPLWIHGSWVTVPGQVEVFEISDVYRTLPPSQVDHGADHGGEKIFGR